jgi:hypothetical protein
VVLVIKVDGGGVLAVDGDGGHDECSCCAEKKGD